jgi:hypothetical protein
VERRAELKSEWKELLDDDAVAALEGGEPGPVEKLEDEVWALAVEDGVEAADERRVRELRERLGLAPQACEGAVVRDPPGPDDLGDDQRIELVVPDEARLVAPPAAEQADASPATPSGSSRSSSTETSPRATRRFSRSWAESCSSAAPR